MNEKVIEWCSELKILSEFAKSQPQAAYAAFCFSEQNKFSYFLRTIPEMNDLMNSVDEMVQNFFLSTIIGETISEKERELYSLPVLSGGLGIPLFSEKTRNELESSLTIAAPLVALIITLDTRLPNKDEMKEATKIITQRNTEQLTNKSPKIEANPDPDGKKAVIQAKEKGASSWLTVIPIEEHGFTLTKNEFRDEIHLRYNKTLRGMPSQCPCGQNCDVTHAMNCKKGGFVIMRHNNV